jgi:hypothetical protein
MRANMGNPYIFFPIGFYARIYDIINVILIFLLFKGHLVYFKNRYKISKASNDSMPKREKVWRHVNIKI